MEMEKSTLKNSCEWSPANRSKVWLRCVINLYIWLFMYSSILSQHKKEVPLINKYKPKPLGLLLYSSKISENIFSHFLSWNDSDSSRVRYCPPAEFRHLKDFHQRSLWNSQLFCIEEGSDVRLGHYKSTSDVFRKSISCTDIIVNRQLKACNFKFQVKTHIRSRGPSSIARLVFEEPPARLIFKQALNRFSLRYCHFGWRFCNESLSNSIFIFLWGVNCARSRGRVDLNCFDIYLFH